MFIFAQRRIFLILPTLGLIAGLGIPFYTSATAVAATLRVVSYNVDADTDDPNSTVPDFGGPLSGPGLDTVLQAIGQAHLNDNGISHAQPIDVLALQELAPDPNATNRTLAYLVGRLNSIYGTGTYAYNTTNDPTDAGTTGNGPSGLIYNTKTVQVVSAAALGTASGSGPPRAPMQYRLRAVGAAAGSDFYVDVSHTKSGDDTGAGSSADRRNVEAARIVANTATLGADAHVISLGDFNITAGSSEATYQTMRHAFDDPANPAANWSDTTTANARTFSSLLSESATSVRFRDDIQFVSPAADSGSTSAGLVLDAGSLSVFGNGGSSLLVSNEVQNLTRNSGVLPDFSASDRANVLAALESATDHLPVVADYDIPTVPEPTALALAALVVPALLRRSRLRGDRS